MSRLLCKRSECHRRISIQPNILSASYKETLKLLSEKPKSFHLIYIADNDDIKQYKEITDKAIGSMICVFQDIDLNEKGRYPPTRDIIEKAIIWAKHKEKILVCCQSGISKSPALAYVIASKKIILHEIALKVLDSNKHIPNLLVVQIGSDILKLPDIFGHAQRFREEVFARMS